MFFSDLEKIRVGRLFIGKIIFFKYRKGEKIL